MAGSERTSVGDRRPRVLINALALHDASDAARTFLENLIERLPEAWPEAEVFALARHGSPFPSAARVCVIRIRAIGSGIARVVDDLARLPGVADRVDADVVISPNESIPTRLRRPVLVVAQNLLYHCPEVGPLPYGSLAARARSRLQFRFYRWQMPRAYARADLVVAVSGHAAVELADHAGLDTRKVRVVGYGADRLPLLPRTQEGKPRKLLIVGSLSHYKRLDVAVRALADLRRDDDDYELVLAGGAWPGYADAIDTLARKLGLSSNVRRLGAVGSQELAQLYAESHALIALSACESFGIPVVEAMRAGLPSVVADEHWSRETVGDAAVRIDGTDPAAVTAAVRSLASPEEWQARSRMSVAAAAKYTWAGNADGIAAAAATLVRERARS